MTATERDRRPLRDQWSAALAFTEPTPSLSWNRFAADLLANCAS